MTTWNKLAQEMKSLLQLKTDIIAVKRLKKAQELEVIPNVQRPDPGFTFCQIPHRVRTQGLTIGLTKEDFAPTADASSLNWRCFRIQGLVSPTEEQIASEAQSLTKIWFDSIDVAEKHMDSYPTPSPIEALVLAPLNSATFEPDFILTYTNTAQMTLLMNGLQHKNYERYQFFFTGEGSCSDGLPQSAATGKPAMFIPCFGERAFGLVADDEVGMALPAGMLEDGVKGLKALKERGVTYPVPAIGSETNVIPIMEIQYPPHKD